jgi:bifunctional lysine-specific demethylase and histidyl-hydroxylase NO66
MGPTPEPRVSPDALALLSGDAQNFVQKVWATHIHVHHTEPDHLVRLLSLDDVDHLLTSTALRAPAVRIAKDGTVLPAATFTCSASLAGQPLTGLVDPRKVIDLFDDGASVVLQGLHRYWPPLSALVRDLELALGHPCQANAYLTPPGSQGFALHSDSHDVIVFQTHGSKHWEVHDAAGVREVLLEPGVSLYLPTGTPHAARTQQSVSLHVTIGINQLTWRDLLRGVTEDVLKDQQYDGRLPAGYLDDPSQVVDELGAHLSSLSRQLQQQDAASLSDEQVARFLTGRNAMLRGGLHDRLLVGDIGDDTVLERRPGSVCVLAERDGRLRVLLGDREIRMPLRLVEPMRAVRELDRLRPADLAGWLDAQSRLVLARRLVREGLLRVAG